MKNLNSNDIRRMFLNFFESKGHKIMPSASLVPKDDPSILWTNAGVAPLKKYFDGREVPPKKRLTNAQKCIRTNDIDAVGDTYHHTFFEMLGNFSIGDYFREEALEYAWELLTNDKYFNIPKDKLYVTVYPDDKETYSKWMSLGLDESHIIMCKGNFWDIGPGPCGPDTEIFFDRGEDFDNRGPELIRDEIDNDRYIEIWNNVFSQFNHVDGLDRSEFPELPHKNIDTGMGLERIVCALEGCKTNYDTDLFKPIIEEVEKLSHQKYTDQKSFRSIADHIRTLVFALSDGVSFSNEGRGYVLRRILRRASRFGRTLGIYEPFMYKLTDIVVKIMGDAYPNIKDNKNTIDKLIKAEEETFLKTLVQGEKRLNELVNSGKKITGQDVFKLYDTYGFPYELTAEILEENNIKIDREEFDICMQKQKQMARNASKKTSGMSMQSDLLEFKEKSEVIGYETLTSTSKVIFVGDDNGNVSDIYSSGIVIFDKTPFYATMGGQEGDIGVIYSDDFKAEVMACEKAPNGQHMCIIRIINGSIKVGDVLNLEVDKEYRFTTCQNHSATHLLQRALKDVVSDSIHQAGSMVNNEILRFDFNYEGKITDEQIIDVEAKVNDMIENNYERKVEEMSLEDAKKTGAVALFDEKYGDVVRVVTLGPSVELCGGTHVTNTGNIRKFAIKDIESKGTNIYRIEAVCDTNLETELFKMVKPYNDEMILLYKKAKKILEDASNLGIDLKFEFEELNDRPSGYKDIIKCKESVQNLRKKIANLQKEYKDALLNTALKNIDSYLSKKQSGPYGDVVIFECKNYDVDILKTLVSAVSSKINNGIVFGISLTDTSINFVCKVSDEISETINAGNLVKDAAKIAEGNGGGSKTFAQGGGTAIDKIDMIKYYIKQIVLEEK